MNLSEDDLALIHALQIAPRVSWSDAADVLGANGGTLAAKWDRIQASGAAWITGHLVGDPSQMSLAFVEVECEISRRPEIIETVCAIPEVNSVDETFNGPGLSLIILTASIEELSQVILPSLTTIPGVTAVEASLCTRLHRGGHSWRLNTLTRLQQQRFRELRHLGTAGTGRLPESHRKMIRMLVENGRVTAAEVARELGGHPATVRRQLNKLLDSDVLSFRCELAQKYSGYPITCQWFTRLPPARHTEAAKELRPLRNIRMVASTTGTTNFRIVMWLQTAADVMSAELTMAARIPELEFVASSLVMNSPKRVGWRLSPDSTATGQVVLPAPLA